MMEFYDEETDSLWLTQVPSLELAGPNFAIGDQYYEEEGVGDSYDGYEVSLEENSVDRRAQVIYDNVVCEDISSDEEVESM